MGNILGDALRMRQAGFDEMQGFREQRARNLAGQQLARGNYAGGSAELYNAGMLDAGAGVQQLGQQQEDRQRTLGDAETAKRAKMLLQIAEALQTVPEPQRMTALQQAAPLFQAAGVDASVLSQIKPEHLTTPALQAFVGQIAKEQYTLTPGAVRYDTSGRMIASNPVEPKYEKLSPGETLVQVGQSPSQGAQGPSGGFDAFYGKYLAPAEGGYAANDGNGAPVNFGINQKSNPDVNVAQLTPEQAKQITYERYWKPSGADQLPPGLAEVQADTAFNMGLGAANDLLQKSGGDVNRYLQLREQRYRAIAQANPDKAKFLPTWLERNQQLAAYVGGGAGQGGARVVAQAAAKPAERWQDLPGGGQVNTLTGEKKGVPTPKARGPLSATALKLQNDHIQALQTTAQVNTNLQKYDQLLASGQLNLGPVSNIVAQGRNAVGKSDQNSRNYESFRSNLEKLRNDSLRLNKGVQTEGDAQRAWNELIKHITDEQVVRQRLAEIIDLNNQAIALRQDAINQIREDAGAGPIDFNRLTRGAAQASNTTGRPDASAMLRDAKDAIRRGAPRDAVIQRLRKAGIDPKGI